MRAGFGLDKRCIITELAVVGGLRPAVAPALSDLLTPRERYLRNHLQNCDAAIAKFKLYRVANREGRDADQVTAIIE